MDAFCGLHSLPRCGVADQGRKEGRKARRRQILQHSLRSESGGEAREGRPAFLHPPNFAMSGGTDGDGGGREEVRNLEIVRGHAHALRGGGQGGHHHEVTKGAKRFVASWIDVRKGTQHR